MLPAVLAGVVALVALNYALVPSYGILGAAVAAMLAQSVWAAVMWLTALRVAKLDVSIAPRLREMFHARRHPAPAE
jgi:O-antigen/teichoic acid export membrane protein